MAHYPIRKLKIFRINGETAEIDAVDARSACDRHPDEWSLRPWSSAEIETAKKAEAEAARESADG
jgi:hypothetical protein